MATKTNVSVYVPNSTVSSMSDEVEDNSVQRAVDAAQQAFLEYDSDGDIPVHQYSDDLAGAVQTALAEADRTEGSDLLVIVSDGKLNDASRQKLVNDALAGLTDDFVVIVNVNNQPDPKVTEWLTWLDDDSPTATSIDVLSVNDLPGDEVRARFA